VSTAKLYTVNRIIGATLKTAANEDADFPIANLQHPSRYSFWKCAYPSPGTLNVDYDCITQSTYRCVGLSMHRAYHGGTGITSIAVSTGTGATYPPTWTSRGSISVGPTVNDAFLDFGSVTVRHVRFAITDGGQYSCKLWVLRVLGFTDLGVDGSVGMAEELDRVRYPETESYLGNKLFYELGVGLGAKQRKFRVPLAALTAAQVAALKGTQTVPSFVYAHYDGTLQEVVYVERDLPLAPLISSVDRYDAQVYLEQLP
jgi:hypothetical protein